MAQDNNPKDALRDSLRSKIHGAAPESASQPGISPTPASGGSKVPNLSAFGNPGLAQMTAFCRQLATLVDVGIPLLQSLKTLGQRTEHPKLKSAVNDVARHVEEGSSFSQALAKRPDVFSSLVVNVARIGETGGILEESLKYLAEIMERRYDLRRRIQSAVAYPVAALIVCAIVIMVILGFAIPVFKKVYKDNGMLDKLPQITKGVISLSDFVYGYWWLILIVAFGLFFFLRQSIRSSADIKKIWDSFIFRVPVISSLVVKINVTAVSRTLSNLLHAGIPLLEALVITSETTENLVVAAMLRKVHDNLEQGGRIDQPFRDANLFPPLVVDMIAIGEEANRLDLIFSKIAETYDSDVNNSIRTLNAVLEPLLIIFMGCVVLVMALAVLLPYWQLGRAIGGGTE